MVEDELTPEVVRAFTDKASREPRFMTLYQRHDYLTAYAKHTDIRVAEDPISSIGRRDEWESHGKIQLDFLRLHGLDPTSRLLDIGCGVGRAARKLVPYLDPGHYVGVDLSPAALDYARSLAEREGWARRQPQFVLSDGKSLGVDGLFDIVWAHSVLTHLPGWAVRSMIEEVAALLPPNGKFLFTYKGADRPNRSGLKQFQYPFQFFAEAAQGFGLRAKKIKRVFPASQRVGALLWGETVAVWRR